MAADVQKIIDGLKALDDGLIKCMKCGFCQNVCPIYAETLMEYDVSRGKLALLSSMADKMLNDTDGLSSRLERCLLCGSCEANCPSGTPIVNIFITARALLAEYKGLSPIKKAIFRSLLPNPKGFDLALKAGSLCQGLVFRKVEDSAQETSSLPLLERIIGNRHVNQLPANSLHAKYGGMDSLSGLSGLRVAFYPGCMADRMYTSVGEACIKVLKHHSVGIFFPTDFACCGIPSLASGDITGFEKQVRQNLSVLKDKHYDYLLTPCGSCTSTIHEYWGDFGSFTENEQAQIKAIAEKTMDITAFLVDVLKVEPKAPTDEATTVTYHDPCHLKKSLKVSTQPRTLISANSACKLVEMKEADRCCGCGGSFNLFHYDISKQIGQRKRDNVIDSQASIVATSCPACMMQLTDTLSRNHDNVQVKHSIELYADSL